MAKKKKKAKSQESEIKAKKKFSFHLKNLSLFAIYTQDIATQTMNIFPITIFFQPVEAFRAHTEAIQGFPPNDLWFFQDEKRLCEVHVHAFL